jgi:rRNA maturation endonuclease Nob1
MLFSYEGENKANPFPGNKRASKSLQNVLDVSSQRCFTFAKEELEKLRESEITPGATPTIGLRAEAPTQKPASLFAKEHEQKKNESFTTALRSDSAGPMDEIQKVVEETKEREGRIRKQLELLKEQAQMAVAECNAEEEDESVQEDNNNQIKDQLTKYESQLTSVKDTMDNILHFTKQTHNEVQRTNDLVSSIHELTPNKQCGSFQSNIIEGDEEFFNDGTAVKYSVIDRSCLNNQHLPIASPNDDEVLSIT